jgi:MoaA/NifB/PqqE/SkfB family radical SAM enzyme
VRPVYSSNKFFHYPERLAEIEAGRVPAPIHVRIKPTNVCNHACYFCAYRSEDMSLGDGMNERDRIPPEKMAEIVDDLIEMDVRAVTFSGGGEPLIYPGIVGTIEALASADIGIGFLTNGSRLKGKVAQAVARHATWIRISIDGWDGPSYARYRSIKEDAFEQLIANLEAFAKLGSPCVVGASMIIDESNAGHIVTLARRLRDADVSHVKLSPCILSNDADEADAYHRPIASTVRAQIEEARKSLESESFRIVDHYHELNETFERPLEWCPFSRLLTVIGADQVVYACQDKAYTDSGRLGSIADRSFREFWHSDDNRTALARIDPNRDCRHHCVAEAKNRVLHEHIATAPDHRVFV